jgi:hypothetical protein
VTGLAEEQAAVHAELVAAVPERVARDARGDERVDPDPRVDRQVGREVQLGRIAHDDAGSRRRRVVTANALPTTPVVKLTLPWSVPSWWPRMSSALPLPGHHDTSPSGGGAQSSGCGGESTHRPAGVEVEPSLRNHRLAVPEVRPPRR